MAYKNSIVKEKTVMSESGTHRHKRKLGSIAVIIFCIAS